jgi:hypothetical protein
MTGEMCRWQVRKGASFRLRDGKIRPRWPAMNPAPRSATVVAALLLSTAMASAQSAPLSDLPGFGKPKRSGYVITVEGGEEGTKSVYYDGEAKKKAAAAQNANAPIPAPLSNSPPVPAQTRVPTPTAPTGKAPTTQSRTRTLTDASGKALPFQFKEEKHLENEDVESSVNRFTRREEDVSQRRFDRSSSESFGKDEKYDKREPVAFGRWGHEGDTFTKETAPGVSFSDRFDTGERVDKKTLFYDRREREVFARSGDKAEIPAWTERFSKDKNARFSDKSVGSTLHEKLAQGYSLLTKVSMQDINRNNFRRNHSTEKGDLPVGTVGTDGVRPMKPASGE